MAKSLVVNRKYNYNLPGDLRVRGKAQFLKSVILSKDPVSVLEAATKQYVDKMKASLDFKESVRVATTDVVDLDAAPLTIDGININLGDRILVKDGAFNSSMGETALDATAIKNGIYVAREFVDTDDDTVNDAILLTRAEDANEPGEVGPGLFAFVEEGEISRGAGYVTVSNNPLDLGIHEIHFAIFTRPETILAGIGLYKDEYGYINIAEKTITDTFLGERTLNDSLGSVDSGDLTRLLSGLANAIKKIKGTKHWADKVNNNLTVPAKPRGLILTDLGGGNVKIQFDIPFKTNNIDKYEVWAAMSGTDKEEIYELRNILSADMLPFAEGSTSRVEYIDRFDKKGLIKFKVFSVNNEIRSEAKTGQIDLTYSTVVNPGDLSTVTTSDFITVHFEKTLEDWIKEYVVKVDIKESEEDLNEEDAIEIYRGFSDGLTYQIKEEDNDKYHQFWVYPVVDFYDLFLEYVKLNAAEGDKLVLSIPEGEMFDKEKVKIYKMDPGETGVAIVVTKFDNSDETDFIPNEYVEFTGVMKLKTEYTKEMVSDGVADYKIGYIDGTVTILSTGAMQEGQSYNIEFNYVPNTKEEAFTARHDIFINLDYANIGQGTMLVTTPDGSTTFEENVDYEVDFKNGKIKVLSTGSMVDGAEYLARYGYGALQLERQTLEVTELDVAMSLGKNNIVEGTEIVTDKNGKEYNSFYKVGEGQLFVQEIDLDNFNSVGTITVQ